MCSYYSGAPKSAYEGYGLEPPADFHQSFVVRISNTQPIITKNSPLQIKMAKWGLVPSWSKTEKVLFSTHNARSDNILKSRVFSTPFKKNHCLVLATAWYEYKDVGEKIKQRHVLKVNDRPYFSFAGIYDVWKDERGEDLFTYSIVTIEPSSKVHQVHDREVAVLKKEDEESWLNNDRTPEEYLNMLNEPYPDARLDVYQPQINQLKRDINGPELLEPLIK